MRYRYGLTLFGMLSTQVTGGAGSFTSTSATGFTTGAAGALGEGAAEGLTEEVVVEAVVMGGWVDAKRMRARADGRGRREGGLGRTEDTTADGLVCRDRARKDGANAGRWGREASLLPLRRETSIPGERRTRASELGLGQAGGKEVSSRLPSSSPTFTPIPSSRNTLR